MLPPTWVRICEPKSARKRGLREDPPGLAEVGGALDGDGVVDLVPDGAHSRSAVSAPSCP